MVVCWASRGAKTAERTKIRRLRAKRAIVSVLLTKKSNRSLSSRDAVFFCWWVHVKRGEESRNVESVQYIFHVFVIEKYVYIHEVALML